jgi:D-alanyl-D-alanine carboxypeptidase/D-alanyl-D-alanine-endopeptidase (penicillin-binding protein 4)
VTRALLAVLAVACAAGPAAQAAEPPEPLRERLAAALAAPGLDPRRTSALAVDLSTGAVVYSHRARSAVAPASTEKLPVAFAALVRLGPAYRFTTEVVGSGRLAGATWRGPLFLKGSGDPTLTSADLAQLAAQVRALGIRRLEGAVVGDESWFDERRDAPGWGPGFVGRETPPLSALVVDRGEGWPRRATALEAAVRFDAALRRAGVVAAKPPRRGVAPPAVAPLARVLSEPLAAIVRFMNRESDNFTAELLLKQLGATSGAGGSTAAGALVVRRTLAEAGIPLAGARLADGSGLSRHDRLSAATLVALLRAAAVLPGVRDAFLSSLAVAGVDGTLERRLDRRPTYGRVIAKTGTTRLSSSLAGFVRRGYAFAILQNGSPVPSWTARAAQDRFVTVLAAAG